MTAQEILQLLAGGFTHDEIIALEHAAPVPVPAPAPAADPVPEPDNQPTPAPAPDPAPAPAPAPAAEPDQPNLSNLIKANAELQMQVAKLTSAVQANAIAGSMLPGGIPNPPDAAQVLGEIIRPTKGK